MPGPNEQKKNDTANDGGSAGDDATESEQLSREQITAIVNSAITGHSKRQQAALEKTIGDTIAKALEGLQQKPANEGGQQQGGSSGQTGTGQQSGTEPAKPDPKIALLMEQHEKLKAQYEEGQKRQRDMEEKQRRDAAFGEVRSALEAKGIKGNRADAVLALMEKRGTIRFTEEGKAVMGVKRIRVKNGPPEELEFEQLARGVDDWTKTPEAEDFIPAVQQQPGVRPGMRPASASGTGVAPGARPAPATHDKPATSEAEALSRTLAQLDRAGVPVDDAVRR